MDGARGCAAHTGVTGVAASSTSSHVARLFTLCARSDPQDGRAEHVPVSRYTRYRAVADVGMITFRSAAKRHAE